MSTRKSLAWSFSQQFGQYVLQFVGSVVIARLLTPHEVGVFSLALAANFLITSLREFGVGSYLIREETLNDDKVRTAFGIWIVTSWSLGLVVLAVRGLFADLYDTPGISDVLTIVSISFFITPLGQPANALLIREMRFDLQHHITLASVLVSVSTNIILAVLGFSYMALAWGMIAGVIVRSLLLIAARPDHLRMLPSLQYWRDVVSFGGWVTATSIVGTINSQGSKFILGGVINPSALAQFERSSQLPITARMAISRPLGRVLLPAFAQLSRDKQRLDESFIKATNLMNVLVWPPMFALAFLSVPVVVLIFGEQWRIAGEIMPYTIGGILSLTLVPNHHEILVATGKVRKLFTITSIMMVFALATGAVASYYGLAAFAAVGFARALLASVVLYCAVAPIVGLSLPHFVRMHLRNFAVATFSAVPAAAAYYHYGTEVPLEAILALVPLSAVFWLLAVAALKHEVLKEVTRTLTSLKNAIGASADRNG